MGYGRGGYLSSSLDHRPEEPRIEGRVKQPASCVETYGAGQRWAVCRTRKTTIADASMR